MKKIQTLFKLFSSPTIDTYNKYSKSSKIIIPDLKTALNINTEKYRFHKSTNGNLPFIFWIGIFDYDYYKKLGITDIKSISAQKGYYIVYLFSKDRKRLYLTLNHCSIGLTKKTGLEKLKAIQDFDKHLSNIIKNKFSDCIYHKKIEHVLTNERLQKARDYESSTFLSKEYNLYEQIIPDKEFINDLNCFVKYWEFIKNYLIEERYIAFQDKLISLTDFSEVSISPSDYNQEFTDLIDDEEYQHLINTAEQVDINTVIILDSRTPIFSTVPKQNNRPITDPRLALYTKESFRYKCCLDQSHVTFLKSNNKEYVEVHHLIPVSFQRDYLDINLDCTCNMITLCPICHSAIHLGSPIEKVKRLQILYNNQVHNKHFTDLLNKLSISSFTELYERFYNHEKKSI